MPSTRTTSAAQAAGRTLRVLEREVADCTACALYRGRTTPVTGEGPDDARLVVVATVPRRHEDLHGLALAGSARNVLEHGLAAAGVEPGTVRMTSVVRCRPEDDREPTADEIATCAGHLRVELDAVRPEVVVGLGAMATSVVLGRPVPLERVAGYRLDVLQGVTLVPTYHPTDVVRGDRRAAAGLRRDLAVAAAVLDGRMASGADAMAELRAAAAAM